MDYETLNDAKTLEDGNNRILAGRYLAVRQLGLAARRQSDAFPDTAVSDTAVAEIVV